jgi:hypothetical protein
VGALICFDVIRQAFGINADPQGVLLVNISWDRGVRLAGV